MMICSPSRLVETVTVPFWPSSASTALVQQIIQNLSNHLGVSSDLSDSFIQLDFKFGARPGALKRNPSTVPGDQVQIT